MDLSGQSVEDAVQGGHQPVPLTWECDSCDGVEWPCEPAKRRLLEGPPDASQVVFAAGYLSAAARDLDLDPAALYERFVAWARPARKRGPQTLLVRDARSVTHTDVASGIRTLLTRTLPLDPVLRWVVVDDDGGPVIDDLHDVAADQAVIHTEHLMEHMQPFVTVAGYTITSVLAAECPLQPPPPGAIAAYEEKLVRAAGRYASRYAEQRGRLHHHRPRVPHLNIAHLATHPDFNEPALAERQLAALSARLDPLGVSAYIALHTRLRFLRFREAGYEPFGDDVAGGPEILGLIRYAKEFLPHPVG